MGSCSFEGDDEPDDVYVLELPGKPDQDSRFRKAPRTPQPQRARLAKNSQCHCHRGIPTSTRAGTQVNGESNWTPPPPNPPPNLGTALAPAKIKTPRRPSKVFPVDESRGRDGGYFQGLSRDPCQPTTLPMSGGADFPDEKSYQIIRLDDCCSKENLLPPPQPFSCPGPTGYQVVR